MSKITLRILAISAAVTVALGFAPFALGLIYNPLPTNTGSSLATPVSIANGGTGTSTQVTNGLNYFDGTRVTSGSVLTFNGTTLANGFQSQGGGIDINSNDSYFGTGVSGTGAFVDVGNEGDAFNIYFDARGSNANIGVVARSKGNADVDLYSGGGSNLLAVFKGASPFNVAFGTSTPVANFQATSRIANSTTTVELGQSGQNKGTCIKVYDVAGTAYYLWVQGGALQVSTSNCASVSGF